MFTCVLGRYVASTVLFSEGADSVGGQLCGHKECPFLAEFGPILAEFGGRYQKAAMLGVWCCDCWCVLGGFSRK